MQPLPARVRVLILIHIMLAVGPLAAPPAAFAESAVDENRWEIGAQGGTSFSSSDERFVQHEALLNYKLPWSWQWGRFFDVGTRVISTAGRIHGGGEDTFIGSLGLGIVFFDRHRFNLRIGSAATYMDKKNYGDEDLGTKFQFTSHLGATCRLWKGLNARVRVQHMSNASLSDDNPGVNILMFGMHYEF